MQYICITKLKEGEEMLSNVHLKDALVENIAAVLLRQSGVTQDELAAHPEKYLWIIDDAWRIACEAVKVVRETA